MQTLTETRKLKAALGYEFDVIDVKFDRPVSRFHLGTLEVPLNVELNCRQLKELAVGKFNTAGDMDIVYIHVTETHTCYDVYLI